MSPCRGMVRTRDGDHSAKGWKFLFENVGVFEVHTLHEFVVHSEHRGRRVLGRKMLVFGGEKFVTSTERS